MLRNFDELMAKVKKLPRKKVVVPNAGKKAIIYSVTLAREEGIADFLLIGDAKKIILLLREIEVSMINTFEIIDEKNPLRCVKKSIRAVREGKANLILKGHVTTSQLMKGVLHKEKGLRTGNIISDVFLFETKERITLMTDGGIVLYPGVKEKVALIKNAVKVAHHLGNPNPKVALICAIEVPNPKMPPTMDALAISEMSKKGDIKGCIVDGPFAIDNAISKRAAKIKNIDSPVAGNADILIMPNIEAGNIFGKTLTYYANLKVAHVIMGAKAPILVTSRADDAWTKLYSIALGILCVE